MSSCSTKEEYGLDRRLNRTLNCHRFTMLRYFRQRNLTMTGTIDVRRVDLEQLSTECRIDQLGGANTKTACSRRYGLQYCVIVIAHDYILNTQGVSYDAIYRHERAHCNGWHHANETVSK